MERNQEIVSDLSSKRQYSGLSPGGLSLWYVFSASEQIVIKIKSLEHREAEWNTSSEEPTRAFVNVELENVDHTCSEIFYKCE